MSKVLLGIVIAVFALHAYQRVREPARVEPTRLTEADLRFVERPDPSGGETSDSSNYRCDGRTHCSHMTSCDEAIYFLRNCPNVKMDGNNDGIPCEKQWCRD